MHGVFLCANTKRKEQTLALKNTDYVAAARLAGDNALELLLRHILPGTLGPILVTATLDIGAMVMELAALSFLGLGAQPPTAELGSMMSENRSMMQTYPWVVMGPGVAIWLTYSSRQELPLLAQSAQASLKEIGIQVEIISTADHNARRQDPAAWDVYANAMVTSPTGDPAYFFATHCLDTSPANNGHYHSNALEELADQLSRTFDSDERARLSQQMQQILLDDDAFVFCSHLQMSLVCRDDFTGFTVHPCDFYEITAALPPRSSQK